MINTLLQNHQQKAQEVSFSALIFELLSGRSPEQKELKLFDLILNLSIDHGPDAPSAAATITSAKAGKEFGEAVGAGIAQINERHGGAIEPLMDLLYSRQKASDLVRVYTQEDKKIPGLGHRVYKDEDLRAELLFETAISFNIGKEYIQKVRVIRDEFEKQSGKSLPVNIDGAIAAILCGFGWESRLGKAVFIIARTPGLCAHFLNTKSEK